MVVKENSLCLKQFESWKEFITLKLQHSLVLMFQGGGGRENIKPT